jgi:transposase
VDQRLQFLSSYQREEMSVTDLCHEYGISRPTAYKWIKRYDEVGPEGLLDLTRTPHSSPHATSVEIENEVLALRKRFPSWGAKKLKARLERLNPNVSWPAASTVGQILSRAGLTNPKRKKRRATPSSQPFSMVTAPNQLWCMDFKGYFLTGEGYRCDPFTITDAHSRFLIRCQAVARMDLAQVSAVCDAAMREFGCARTHPHGQRSTILGRRPAGPVEVVTGMDEAGYCS